MDDRSRLLLLKETSTPKISLTAQSQENIVAKPSTPRAGAALRPEEIYDNSSVNDPAKRGFLKRSRAVRMIDDQREHSRSSVATRDS